MLIKVIIVDDEPAIREGIKNAVNWEKYDMEISAVVGSSAEALDQIEKSPPDVIILDICLDGMDGLEILEIVRHKYPNIFVILISGHDEFEYARRAVELNAFCYLLKPIDIDQLCTKLMQIVQHVQKKLEQLKKDKELNERLKESIPVIREHLFYEIIRGRNLIPDKINKKANFLGIDLDAKEYVVIVLELNLSDSKSEYDKNLLKYAVMELCEEAFTPFYKCYSFNLRENIGLLICGEALQNVLIKDISLALLEKINNSLGTSITIGIGSISHEITSVTHSYKEAVNVLEYKILIGLNRVIDSESILFNTNMKFERNLVKGLFDKRKDELKYALKTVNDETVNSIANDITETLRSSLKNNIKNFSRDLLQLSNSLSDILIGLDINVDSIFSDGNELYTTFKKQKTIEGIAVCLKDFFQRIMEEIKNRQNINNSFYVNKARDYIEKNLYGELSLSSVADYLYVSSNYLSRIFKQEVGESFIEYVIRGKMFEAKRLLETSTYKVYEIANELNYKDVNYFTKTFKKTFGVTPSEYRELI